MTEQKNSIPLLKFLPGIAWFLFGLLLICLPGDDVPDKPNWLQIAQVDKMVHAALFGGIVFLFCMPFKKNSASPAHKLNVFIKLTMAAIVWGIATEYIQKFFITGRQFDLADWAADSAGAIIAFFISCKLFLNPAS